MTYVPIHVHTTYSKLDGASKIPGLLDRAVELKLPAVNILDHGTLSGWIEFYEECEKRLVKPMFGIELYYSDDRTEKADVKVKDSHGEISGTKHYYHLTAIAADNDGYHNLIKVSTDSYVNGLHRKPRTDLGMLSQHSKGVVVGTGCLGSPVQQALFHDNYPLALQIASDFKDVLEPGNLFVELMNHGLPEQKACNPLLLKIAGELGLPVMASLDSHYTYREDASKHDLMLCCSTKSKVTDEKRFRFSNDEFYLKSFEEMSGLFPYNPEFLSNTVELAERCNVDIEFGVPHLPKFDVPQGFVDDVEYLRHLVYVGAKEKYGEVSREVEDRIEYELKHINDMGVTSYFLIVWDLVKSAKDEGILVGPGRGSSAGSCVFYCLGVTMVEPLRYGLFFERFLNPGRFYSGYAKYDPLTFNALSDGAKIAVLEDKDVVL